MRPARTVNPFISFWYRARLTVFGLRLRAHFCESTTFVGRNPRRTVFIGCQLASFCACFSAFVPKNSAMTHLSEHSDPTDALPNHTLESILACLPFPSVPATRCVSKRWHSLATSSTFLTLYSERQEQSESWLYVNGFRYKITDHTSSPTPSIPESSNHSWGAGGLAYTYSETSSQLHTQLQYKISLLDLQWLTTPALPLPRTLPIVAAVTNLPNGAHKVIVAGGLPSDTSKESLSTVSIFDSASQTWSSCEDLPREFQGIATTRSVTAVVSNRTLYLFHIYSGMVSSLDVTTRRWSPVMTLRPPGMQYCYLAARHGALLLVGVSHENDRFCFRGWNVAASVMECYGESWPVVCHFGSLKSSRSFGNWQSKKQSDEAVVVLASASVMDPILAIANLLKRISFCARIFGFFETLLEFRKAIS